MRSLLAVSSIHEFPSRSNDFLLAFTQSNHDADVLMEIHLGMVVDVSHAGTELTVIYILYQPSHRRWITGYRYNHIDGVNLTVGDIDFLKPPGILVYHLPRVLCMRSGLNQ